MVSKTSKLGRIITWLALLFATVALIGQLASFGEQEIGAKKLRELQTRIAKLESGAAKQSSILVALFYPDEAFMRCG